MDNIDASKSFDNLINDLQIILPIHSISVEAKQISEIRKNLNKFFKKYNNIPPIYCEKKGIKQKTEEQQKKYLLFSNVKHSEANYKIFDYEPEYTQHELEVELSKYNYNNELITYKKIYKYDELNYKFLTKLLLPSHIIIPTSYETIGHIIHLNLNIDALPYKHIIGRLLLDKSNSVKTVINKIENISSIFRECKFELLAGVPNYKTITHENGYKFFVDYENVYWNSKLANERERIANDIPESSIVYDVMAGVGGFGVYLVKRKNCIVTANDLNPHAVECIKTNIHINKIKTNMYYYNNDGKKFIEENIKTKLTESKDSIDYNKLKKPKINYKYFIMNLPDSAINFLKYFEHGKNCYIYLYCFCNPDNFMQTITEKVKLELPKSNILNIHNVRNVAPNKNMYCVKISL